MKREVHSVSEHDTVATAAQVMREHEVGFLPVCDQHGIVVGVVTDRDLVVRACAEGCDPSTVVSRVMTRARIACRPEDPISRADALMRRHRISRVVITDAGGAPAGVLSLSDLAQYEAPTRVGRTIQRVAERKYAPERP
jgi:CBS domain-containing protein